MTRRIWRQSSWDAMLAGLALLHGALLLTWPSVALIAIGVWWNSNTIAHNFIHKPFFRRTALNVAFALYQSVLMGIPQSIWRQRHLAHHAERPWRLAASPMLAAELLLIALLWAALVAAAPTFFAKVYLPGYLIGLALCHLQGHYEHAHGRTTSHYGRLYNLLCFNDGYHVEHHEKPGIHWTRLPQARIEGQDAAASRWPAVLRWIDDIARAIPLPCAGLCLLESVTLRCRPLQRWLLCSHQRALRHVLKGAPPPRRIGIVGGGMFPRSVLVLHNLFPEARIIVIEAEASHIETARRFIGDDVLFVNEWFDPLRHAAFDLLVIPLAYDGNRERVYEQPPAPRVLIHDWLWRRRGKHSAVISWALLKRINLVTGGRR
jgi:hypothetical protein